MSQTVQNIESPYSLCPGPLIEILRSYGCTSDAQLSDHNCGPKIISFNDSGEGLGIYFYAAIYHSGAFYFFGGQSSEEEFWYVSYSSYRTSKGVRQKSIFDRKYSSNSLLQAQA